MAATNGRLAGPRPSQCRLNLMSFKDKDHFSGHAGCYEAFRPTYPDALFEYLASLCPLRELAWDCATGNGQAAVPLAANKARPRTSSRRLSEPFSKQAKRSEMVDSMAASFHARRVDMTATV